MTTLAQIALADPVGTASSTVAWFTLAGALGGVAIAGIIGLATATLNQRWQARGDDSSASCSTVRKSGWNDAKPMPPTGWPGTASTMSSAM
jgi:hypothetical protein